MLGEITTVEPNFSEDVDLKAVLGWADERRRLGTWANADREREAAHARELGAEGIGLCRTEHMFEEAERLPVVRQMILNASKARAGDAGGEGALHRGAGDPARLPEGRLQGAAAGDGRPAGRSSGCWTRRSTSSCRSTRTCWSRSTEMRLKGETGPAHDEKDGAAPGRRLDARVEPDARPAGLPPRPDVPRDQRDAGPGHLRGGGRAEAGGQGPPPRDHDPAGRRRPRAAHGQGPAAGGGEGRDQGRRRPPWTTSSGR